MSAGIVVLAYGAGGEYLSVLDALLGEGVDPESIMVVHNPASTGEPALEVPNPQIAVVRAGRNLGYAGGMNLGLARQLELGNDPIVLLTHDTRLRPGAYARLLDAWQRLPAYGVLGPALVRPDSDVPFSFGGRSRPNGSVGHVTARPPAGPDGVMACDWVDGAALVLRRAAVEQLDGFEERFFAYCEELELCLRIRGAGWAVGVVPEALAEQAPGGKKRLGAWSYLITRNGMEYARRAVGVRGVVATLRRALWRMSMLGVQSAARGVRLRSGPAGDPWSEFLGVGRGALDFLRGRWGPPPAGLRGLGDMSVPTREERR